jgi:mRNA-degrading endonuclease HigB of HigAB toxin-antitoxin module
VTYSNDFTVTANVNGKQYSQVVKVDYSYTKIQIDTLITEMDLKGIASQTEASI